MYSCICRFKFVSKYEECIFFPKENYMFRIENYPNKFAYRVYYKSDSFIRFNESNFNYYFNVKKNK